jgi:D-amino-acid oxidase
VTDCLGSGTHLKVLVIGAGVVGLTTALSVRRAGHEVVVVADRFAPDITSVIAGALWEWPPAVCGHHRDEDSIERSKSWCMTSYRKFHDLAGDERTGVYLRPAVFYFRRPIEENPIEHLKMTEMKENVNDFHRDPGLAERNGVSPDAKVQDAYSYLAPMVDTDTYMKWLMDQVTDAGCAVVQARLDGDLVAKADGYLDAFEADAIINCTGLGAMSLTGESMYPLRGALVYAHNDGRSMPRVTSAHAMSYDESIGGQNMVFIVPRGRDLLVLGGLVEPGEWGTDLTLENYPPIRDMLRRCQEFLPVLRDATLVANGTVRTGLRPARSRGVRLEHERGTRIIHNVGHGGSGVSFSWGCAREVVTLLAQFSPRASRLRSTPVSVG